MRRLALLFTLLVLLTCTTNLLSQTTWEKYQGNPILELGSPGSWEDHSNEACTILIHEDNYHLWYSGYDGTNSRIGHATSSDGITWTKDSQNPVLDIGIPGSWEERLVYMPCVIFDGSNFHLWYAGNDYSSDRIGHATSQDGTNWTKDSLNPVIDLGQVGSWEDFEVFPMAGSVIFNGFNYQMWYGGGSTSNYSYSTGYATSEDGSIWTKDSIHNPVMTVGSLGKWDSQGVIPGTIKFNGTNYYAWYSGCGGDYRYRVGYATSEDGVSWIKDTLNNPVLDFAPPGFWDHIQAWNGSVLFDSVTNTYKMWYTGGDFFSGRIGYATSLITSVDENMVKNNSHIFKFSTYPNPFSTSTTIEYTLNQTQFVTITFYNHLGEMVDMIQQKQAQGKQQVTWNAGEQPAGIYYFRLEAGDQTASGKVVLVR